MGNISFHISFSVVVLFNLFTNHWPSDYCWGHDLQAGTPCSTYNTALHTTFTATIKQYDRQNSRPK